MVKNLIDDMDEIHNNMLQKCVRDSLDTVILALLKKSPMCGYDIISQIHKRFKLLLSPGTLYPLLYKLEKQELVNMEMNGRKKVYSLAEGSAKAAEEILTRCADTHKFLARLMLPKEPSSVIEKHKKKILKHMASNGKAYQSDISTALRLDSDTTWSAIGDLVREDKLGLIK